MADKEGTERKVWLLPTELSDRIRAYQADLGIASEVEAARRLLDSALQMRDTVEDIAHRLKIKYTEEKDLRVLVRDILASHVLVTEIHLADDKVAFRIRSGMYGLIDNKGKIFSGEEMDYIREIREQPTATTRQIFATTQKGGDLDDEIPF